MRPDRGACLPGAAAEQRLALVQEVRESIELVHTAEYANFLRVFFPPFVQLLQTLPPSLADNPQHKLRNMLLEVLNRCARCPRPFSTRECGLCVSLARCPGPCSSRFPDMPLCKYGTQHCQCVGG